MGNKRRIPFASISLLALTNAVPAFGQQTLPVIDVGARGAVNGRARSSSGAATRARISASQQSSGAATTPLPIFTNATFRSGPTGVDNYLATGTFTATRTNTKLLDIPQAVSIVTKKQMEDRAVLSLGQALQYTPGVVVSQGEGSRDQVLIRGQNTTADFYVDGMRDDAEYFRDIYNIDSVEVLKGPSALIFGRGGGGGIINRVTKKADFNTIRNFWVYTGSFAQKRLTADVGQAINNDLAFRLNGMYEHSYGFRDHFKLERYGINPAFTWRPLERTFVTASYEHFSDRRTADRGIPSIGGIFVGDYVLQPGQPWFGGSRSDLFGMPSNIVHNRFDAVRVVEDHTTDFGLNIHNQTAFVSYGRQTEMAFPDDDGAVNANLQVPLRGYRNDKPRVNIFNRTDLTYGFEMTPDIRHTVLVGAEFGYQKSFDWRNRGLWNDPVPRRANRVLWTTVFNPTVYNQMFFTQMQRRRRTDLDVASGYIQDQIAITPYIDVLAGVRFDSFSLRFQSNLNEDGVYTTGPDATRLGRVDNVWSPRFGLVVKPWDGLSLYGAYSRSFLPAAGDQFTNLDGELVRGAVDPQTLAPQSFKNIEAGFKAQVMPRLLFTGAIYQLDRNNQIIEYQEDFNLVTSTRTSGGEIALIGNPTDEWSVTLGYGHQRSNITRADRDFAVGKVTPSVPLNTFSFWNKYDMSSLFDASPGTIGVGGGVIHNSSFFPSPDNAVLIPGYTRVDGAVYVQLSENISGQLNIENIGGIRYYPTAHRNNLISPGAPRSALFTLHARF